LPPASWPAQNIRVLIDSSWALPREASDWRRQTTRGVAEANPGKRSRLVWRQGARSGNRHGDGRQRKNFTEPEQPGPPCVKDPVEKQSIRFTTWKVETMNRQISAANAPKPFSNYAQAIEIPAGSRILHVAGQVGVGLDGHIPEDPARQHELCWENAFAILAAAGMNHTDVVDAHVFITDRAHIGIYREIRDRMLKGHRAAATLLIVSGLADPRLVVEVAIVAAAPAT
jgi:2-iminobutanoate/2-iminopropanoate deaminase